MYRRVEKVADLEAALSQTESWEVDFKAVVDTSEWWELAKDMAAFANNLGGVLLVGVHEQSSGRPRIVGLDEQDATRIGKTYETVARDKCLPRPLVTTAVLHPSEAPGRCVLAVNVDPVPDQLVGAMFCARNKNGAPVPSDAWRFPIRINRDNVPITPDRFPMFIDPKIRRTAIMLSLIPAESTPSLVWRRPGNQFDESPVLEEIFQLDVALPTNVLRARRVASKEQPPMSIPLDDIEAVWEASQGQWRIRITGWLDARDGYVSNPSNAVFKR